MGSQLNPYLQFDGTAREAMQRYQDIFGGTLEMTTFGEFGMAGPAEQLIMHATLRTPDGFVLMGSDTAPGMAYTPAGNVALSLSGDDQAALRGFWELLSDGGEVQLKLERQMWGDLFGQCTDRFGIRWMVNIATG